MHPEAFKYAFHFENSQRKALQISNVVKNFVIGLMKLLICAKDREVMREKLQLDSEPFEQAVSKIKMFLNTRQQNNLMIRDIFRDKEIAPLFIYFLKYRADDWIKSSRIKDKDAYREVVVQYLLVSQQEHVMYTRRKGKKYKD